MNESMLRIAAVEGGGTKFVCAVCDGAGRVLERVRIPTVDPVGTLRGAGAWFADVQSHLGPVAGVGVGCFGGLDLDPGSTRYGALTTTPKPGWGGFELLARVRTLLGDIPGLIDTDVNCAALGENLAGAGCALRRICYITVGTGIGVGLCTDGGSGGGIGHLEAGHLRVPRFEDDAYPGCCAYHGDCVEGLACGPAMEQRWQVATATDLPADHRAWKMECHYLGTLCANLAYAIRPQRIVVGGGVFTGRQDLFPRLRAAFETVTAGFALSTRERDTETYIVPPGSTRHPPGLVGAIELGRRAAGLEPRRPPA